LHKKNPDRNQSFSHFHAMKNWIFSLEKHTPTRQNCETTSKIRFKNGENKNRRGSEEKKRKPRKKRWRSREPRWCSQNALFPRKFKKIQKGFSETERELQWLKGVFGLCFLSLVSLSLSFSLKFLSRILFPFSLGLAAMHASWTRRRRLRREGE